MKLIAIISFLVIVLALYSTFVHEAPDSISLPSNAPAQSLTATDLVLPPSDAPAQSLTAPDLILPPSDASAQSLTAPDLILPPSNASFQSLAALLDIEEASSSREHMRDVHRNKIEFLSDEAARSRVIMLDPERMRRAKTIRNQVGMLGEPEFTGVEHLTISVFEDTTIEIEFDSIIPGHSPDSWTYVGRVTNDDPVPFKGMDKVLITVLDTRRVLIRQIFFGGSIYRIYPLSMNDGDQSRNGNVPQKGKMPHVVWELIPGATKRYIPPSDPLTASREKK